MNKEKKVSLIENGTVLDHLPSNSIFNIINILDLEKADTEVLIGINLSTKTGAKKGLIKLNNRYLDEEEKKKIALIASNSTLNEIKSFEVKNKSRIEVPDKVEKIVKCFNPNCITNNEPMKTSFKVLDKKEIKLECDYCERVIGIKEIVII